MSPAPVSSRTLRREATRRSLVDAGLRVVADRGFAGATTAAIAEASGRAHGTVFVHFPTRDALVAELVEEIGRAMADRLSTAAGGEPGVAAVLRAHLAALGEHEVLWSRLLAEAPTLPPAARARVFALQSGVASRLATALARDARRGQVRDVDPVLLANLWIALTNHYLVHRDLFAPGGSVIAARGAELEAQLLALLRP
jgi:AcrR family transcriptional regulator